MIRRVGMVKEKEREGMVLWWDSGRGKSEEVDDWYEKGGVGLLMMGPGYTI